MRLNLVIGAVMAAMLAFLATMAAMTAPREPGHYAAITHPHGGAQEYAGPVDHPPLLVPVAGVVRSQVRNTWGAARDGGLRRHQGIDIPAPEGTSVLAAAPGTIEKLFYSNGGGGIVLYIRSPDRQWSYYYAHLKGYAPGLAEGMRVKAGDAVAFVGDSGNAGKGNFHLHFAMSHMGPADRWWQGEPLNPWPLLTASE